MAAAFTFVFKYVWFIFGLFALAQSVFLLTRAGKIAASTGDDPAQARRFIFGYAVYYVTPYFVLGALQFLGGYDSAFYVFFAPLTDPFVLAAIGFFILWWALGLYILWARGGARTLIRYQLIQGARNETFVKLFFGAGIVFIVVWVVLFRFLVPPPPF